MLRRAREFENIRSRIMKAGDIAISGHANPDGDSIGSLLALGLGLERLGKRVYMLCQDEIPPDYRSLPGADRIRKTVKKNVDLAIAVDCSTMGRLGKSIPVFKKAKAILEIDHHEFREDFSPLQLIEYEAASVGELVYVLLKKLGVKIDRTIAENLLTSIIVETNLFKLANIRPLTFRICAELTGLGIDFSQLTSRVYGPKTKETMRLLAVCISRAKFSKQGRIVRSLIRHTDLVKAGAREYDVDAIANEMCYIRGVEIAVLFREKTRRIFRVSLRSRGGINIGKVARMYGGGGHSDIAGCHIANEKSAMRRLLRSAEDLIH